MIKYLDMENATLELEIKDINGDYNLIKIENLLISMPPGCFMDAYH